MTAIVDIIGREILDSRGNPTVEVDIAAGGRLARPRGRAVGRLHGGARGGRARDGDKRRYLGKGVLKAVDAVNGEIFDALSGMDAEDQRRIDDAAAQARRHAQQGPGSAPTPSWACRWRWPRPRRRRGSCRSTATSAACGAHVLPVPMMNIINGGAHADNPIDIQEFMIMPVGAASFADALRMGAEMFHTLNKALEGRRPRHQRRRRGRLRARTSSRPRRRSSFVMKAIEAAGYKAGRRRGAGARLRRDRVLQGRQVRARGRGQERSTARAWSKYLAGLVARYPIVSIEDGMAEDDWDGWKALTDELGGKVPAGGRRPVRHQHGAARARHRKGHRQLDPGQGQPDRLADRDARRRGMAQRAGYTAVISHRSGETEDATIADLAVATNAGQIKTGSLVALRPRRQVQSAAPHRGGAGRRGALRGEGRAEGALTFNAALFTLPGGFLQKCGGASDFPLKR